MWPINVYPSHLRIVTTALTDRPPEAKFLLVLFVINTEEILPGVFDPSVQGGVAGISRKVNGGRMVSHIDK